jgi:hypothetical protein
MAECPGMTMATSRPHAGALALLAALTVAATGASPASAWATTPPAPEPATFALAPAGATGALRLRGVPGRVLHGAVRVRNLSRHPITVRLRPADIRTASNGNADYVTTRLSQTGRWLHLAATTVRLAPHTASRVAFTVRIPAGTRGASHYTGIVAIDAADLAAPALDTTAKSKSFTFARINRQALPLTIRLPGPRSRSLALRSARLVAQPVGAGLVLGLLPGGSELIQQARIHLRVLRGSAAVFTYAATLGQLFPGAALSYRIPWRGRPTPGTYHLLGVISPQGARAVNIDQTVDYTPATATELKRVTPPAARQPQATGMPVWVWLALATAAALLLVLSLAVWKLARRPRP